MADSPSKYGDRTLVWTIRADGREVEGSFELVSAQIRTELNRIGKATLRFNAGTMERQTFDESDSDRFRPGTAIRIDAGEPNEQKTLFEGIVLETGIRIGRGLRSQLVVECRDCAYPATQGRRNRIFEQKSDAEMIAEALSDYGRVSVDSTDYRHPQAVQYYCARSRADACGMFVLAAGGGIRVFRPETDAAPVLTVTYGNDLIAFDGALSAGGQFPGYDAVSWDPAEQQPVRVSASAPTLNALGARKAESLPGGGNGLLQTDAPTDAAVLKAWAESLALKDGLARYRGRIRFCGAAEAVPGCLIELKGLGKRFDGKAFIGSVTHLIERNEWITEAGIGIDPAGVTDEPDATAPPAAGLLPGLAGLHTAVVRKIEGDPAGEYRIQVALPWLDGVDEVLWARLSTLYATKAAGSFWLPEPGDEVLVGFVNDDPGRPVLLGSLYGSRHEPPCACEAKNNTKAFVTREKLQIVFDEEKKAVTISTPAGNRVELSDDGKSVVLSDANGSEIRLDKEGIALSSAKDIALKAKGSITLDAAMKFSAAAKQDAALEGLNVKVQAQMGASVKGDATAELSAGGQTTVKGALVMIN